jgi:hypothetical protein
MKVTIKLPKPRNPLAVLARQRKAGSHQRDEQQSRRALKQQLRRQLAQPEE